MDAGAKTTAEFSGGAFAYSAKGVLTGKDGAKGAPFEIAYRLDAKGLSVKARVEGKFRYVFPVVATEKDEVSVEGNTARVKRPGGTLTLTADREIKLLATQRGARAFNPVAGLMAAVFYIEGEDGEAGLSVVVE
jgi:hypothetical protein